MPIITVIPEQDLPAGRRTFAARPVPGGIRQVTIRVRRIGWPQPTVDVVKALAELSLDGGATWTMWLGFTARGGEQVRRDGTIATMSTVTRDLPEPTNPSRRLRGEVELFFPLRAEVQIEWL